MDIETQCSGLTEQAEQDGIRKFVVGAVVAREGKVLLLRRPEDDFMGGIMELPSGGVEGGESLIDALKREVREEAGLDVDVGRYLGHFDYVSKSGKRTRQFNFLVSEKENGDIVLTEHDSHEWVLPEAAEDIPVTDAVRGILRIYSEKA